MDARLVELSYLSKIDRRRSFDTSQRQTLEDRDQRAERDLIKFLILRDFVTGPDIPWQHHDQRLLSSGMPGESELERSLHQQKLDLLSKVFGGRGATLTITHAGRARMAELAQGLRSGRIREPFGILWDGRHCDQDLKIYLLDASENSAVTVAYLDLNGMKKVNDSYGHNAGDIVLRAYFHAIKAGLGDSGEAYRKGGDETIIIFNNCSAEDAKKTIERISRLLMNEALKYEERLLPKVSIAAGVAVSRTASIAAESLREQADKEMYRAKEFTKEKCPRPSSLATQGDERIQEFI
jgi:diguanylate cyclase (GGDEF)-like protein